MELLLHEFKSEKKEPIFDLHSNMELLLPTKELKKVIKLTPFTFQYGATSTQFKIYTIWIKLLFTFQYGATSTNSIVIDKCKIS